MIAGLRGQVEEVGSDWLLVNVGGVVYRVFAATSTLASVSGPGAAVSLHTHMQVRDDAITLYGFARKPELRMFQMLLAVSGVGPRSALAMLSAIPLDDLAAAIASEDLARLSSVPGVGKRTAARIALELKGKVGVDVAGAAPVPASRVAPQLLAALMSLGYSNAEATTAIQSVADLEALDLEEALRSALRALAGDR